MFQRQASENRPGTANQRPHITGYEEQVILNATARCERCIAADRAQRKSGRIEHCRCGRFPISGDSLRRTVSSRCRKVRSLIYFITGAEAVRCGSATAVTWA